MSFTTYENRTNPHVAIHRSDCNQLRKRGGEAKTADQKYEEHATLAAAKLHASATGLPIQMCSFCKP